MSNSQPPYGSYPSQEPQNQPQPEQPSEVSNPIYPNYGQPGTYPPPPAYPSTIYPGMMYPAPPPTGQPPVDGSYGPPGMPMYPPPYIYVVPAPQDPEAVAAASFILGIVSIIFVFVPCLGFISLATGIAGLVTGIMGRKSVTQGGLAITGIVLSSIALGLTIIFGLLWISLSIFPQFFLPD